MKLNISYPVTGGQKVIDVEDENKLRAFFDKRISAEVSGDVLGDEFKGYIFRISGGNDKQGFAMKQGILTNQRVRILFHDGMSCFRIRKRGERKRKSIRGCIVSSELSVLNLVVIKKGEAEIEGITTSVKPRRLGPKRATRIRQLFNLDKNDDVRKYVIRRKLEKERKNKKPLFKAPKIQRLVTPQRLQHKRQYKAEKKARYETTRKETALFQELVAQRFKEAREARFAEHQKRRSVSRKLSEKDAAAASSTASTSTTTTPAPAKPAASTATTATTTTKSEKKAKAAATASSSTATTQTTAPKTDKKKEKKDKPAKAAAAPAATKQ